MQQSNRWTRAMMAVACLLAGLTPGSASVSAEAPVPPVPDQLAPAGGGPSHLSTPNSCDFDRQIWSAIPGAPISDNTVITSTRSFPAIGAAIWEVWVTTQLTHTNSADLEIVLVSPAGTRVTLTTDNGSDHDNVFNGTLWADNAGRENPPGPVTLASYTNLVPQLYLSPEEPLSAFLGEAPGGVWTLEVKDDASNSSLGQLNSWDLQITALVTTPTPLTQSIPTVVNLPIPANGTPLLAPFEVPAPMFRYDTIELVTNLTHANVGDLEIYLLPAESNSPIVLAYHQGGDRADVISGTHWLDAAGAINLPGAVTDNDFTIGVVESALAPQEPLRAASSGLRDGPWTLVISDTANIPLTGTLTSLTAIVTTYACAPELRVDAYSAFNPRLDAPMPLVIPVKNEGLTTTAPVFLTVTLPISLSYLSTTSPGWACSNPAVGSGGGSVLCNRAGLNAGALSTVTVQLSPPAVPQIVEDYNAEVTSTGSAPAYCECDGLYPAAHSANNNPWDVYDKLLYPNDSEDDSGAVGDGGQDAFDVWGELRVAIYDTGDNLLLETSAGDLKGFGLTYTPAHRWATTTPISAETISMARSLYAPINENWLRYVDTFTNTGGAGRTVYVQWGGALGSDDNTVLLDSSSGDALLTTADTWGLTVEQDVPPVGDPPLAYVLRSVADTTFQGPAEYGSSPITTTWPVSGEDHLGFVYRLVLAPGASASLAYFVYRGLGEGRVGPQDCQWYGDCQPLPTPGSEVALAESQATAMALHPPFCDLRAAERAKIVNWPGAVLQCRLYVPVTFR